MTSLKRRNAVLALLFAATASLPPAVHAQAAEYPSRPIRIVIGFPPGGSTDGPMRVLAEHASKALKQPIVIESRTGAGGALAAMSLQSAANDGYTMAVAPISVYRVPFTTDTKFDPLKDLSYVIGLTGYAFGVVVPASSPIQSWSEYLAYAKIKPGQLTYGTPGAGTTNHLTMEQIASAAGVKLNHIPFKGSAESIQALLGGHVDSGAETSAWAPYVQSGKMRLLVVWGDKRMPSFPNVPTLKELGINMSQTSHWGIVAPKGTDPAIIAKVHNAFKQAMETPEFKKILAQYDMEPEYRSSEEFYQYAVRSSQEQKAILDALGLSRKP